MSPKQTGHGGNPYIDQLSSGLERAGVMLHAFSRRKLLDRFDVVHVHWPEHLIRWERMPVAVADVAKVLILLKIARMRGSRLVWTAHDLGPHERPLRPLYNFYERMFLHQTDYVISLAGSAHEQVMDRFPSVKLKPHAVVAHGHYRSAYERSTASRRDSRASLGIDADAPLVLVFGQLRRYKAIETIMRVFVNAGVTGAHLLVVGETKDAEYTAQLESLAAQSPAIHFRAERVADEEVPELVNAADLVATLYSEGTALHSGAVLMALSLNRAVIARPTPVMKELQRTVGPQWVHLASDGEEARGIQQALQSLPAESSSPDLEDFEWHSVIDATVSAYDAATGVSDTKRHFSAHS